MTDKNRKIHRITVNSAQPIVVPRRGTLALRKSRLIRRRMQQAFYVVGFTLSMVAIAQASYGFLMGTPYLHIKPPKIEGVGQPLALEIAGLVDTMTRSSRNILEIDEEELAEQIGRHPKIRELSVEKVYPDQLIIHAVEREAVAVLVTEKNFFLADIEGHAMDKLDTKDLVATGLPYISGLRTEVVHEGEQVNSPSLTKALNLLQVLNERNPALYNEISEIEIQTDGVSPLETLTAHMKGGLDVRFGDTNPIDKLPQFETLLKKLRTDGVNPFEDLVYIDLRFKDMAFFMDIETALVVERNQYEELQARLDVETEKYEKAHPQESKEFFGDKNSDSGVEKVKASSKPKSQGSARTAVTQSAGTARAMTGHERNTNYQQQPQQYYPQQYNQQRVQYPAQQSTTYYNLPANQQRY